MNQAMQKLIELGHSGKVKRYPASDCLLYFTSENKTYFIDERTKRNAEGIYVIKPLAENDRFFFYACPLCQSIHIEGKRSLNVPLKRVSTKCHKSPCYEIIIDCEADPVAFQNVDYDVYKGVLYREYMEMKQFEGVEDG